MEVWKEKKLDFESMGLEVSCQGNVRNSGGRIKAITDNGAGYKKTTVTIKGSKVKNYYIHRLVAELFISEPCEVKNQVNHIDGNKENNHVDNLEWVSAKDNIKHMHDNNMNTKRRNHGKTYKLSDKVVTVAYSKVVAGVLGVAQSAKLHGMPRTTLSSIVNKRCRRDVTDVIDSLFHK